uniref:F-box domain-containing protein n=1 Tax=Strongyloides stercoralis TaxID=6248 RepID=A0A0K0EQ69_STRER
MIAEINEMKSMILKNQETIHVLMEKIKKLEEDLYLNNNKFIMYDRRRQLTAIEKVGHNLDIMSLIIDRITNIKDRKNIELTCKTYYFLSNRRNSYLPLIGYEARNPSTSKWQENEGFTLLIRNEEIEINIPEKFFFNQTNSPIIRNALEKYIPKMRILYIMKLFPWHVDFFEKLKCFKNIEIVKFSRYALQVGGGEILEKCKSLKPHTFIANNNHMVAYNIKSFSSNEKPIIFPTTLRNIYYDCHSEDVMWLLSSLKIYEIRNFDNLFITKEMIDYLNNDEMKLAFLKILTYFKNVNYFANDFLASDMDKDFGKVLAEYNITTTLSINFGNDLNNSKRITNVFDRECTLKERKNTFDDKTSRILAHPGFYINTKKLAIFDWNFSRICHSFEDFEITKLSEDLSMMGILNTLEIDFYLISEYSSCFQIFSTIKNKLKNLKICHCWLMEQTHLDLISEFCSKIENLSLIGIKNTITSIEKITSIFKNLKSLEIEFQNQRETSTSACEILTFDNIENSDKFKWPTLQFLLVTCNLKKLKQRDYFKKMERETSRKAGIFYLREFYRTNELFIEVIIQKNQSCYDEFKKLFTKR